MSQIKAGAQTDGVPSYGEKGTKTGSKNIILYLNVP